MQKPMMSLLKYSFRTQQINKRDLHSLQGSIFNIAQACRSICSKVRKIQQQEKDESKNNLILFISLNNQLTPAIVHWD